MKKKLMSFVTGALAALLISSTAVTALAASGAIRIEVSPISVLVDGEVSKHFKAAIQVRNREIIDRSDMVICYITHKSGGAYQSVQYAEKLEKRIINIAEDPTIMYL